MCITLFRSIILCLFFLFLLPAKIFAQNINQVQTAREYYNNGDVDKARATFEQLAKNRQNIPFIHNQYLDILLSDDDASAAQKYIKLVKKWYPDNIYYTIDEGLIYARFNEQKKADEIFAVAAKHASSSPTLVRTTAQYFFQKNLTEQAIKIYEVGRKASGNPWDFAIDLANIYRRLNNKDKMVDEYLNFVQQNPANLSYVQNLLQNVLTETEDLEAMQALLYSRLQKSPNYTPYSELLVWVNVQLRNFNGAFVQARALDRLNNENGKRLLEIGKIAFKNEDYENAEKIFQHIIDTYKTGLNYELARRFLIKAREEAVKNTFPINEQAIHTLINDYRRLIDDLGITGVSLEAMRSKALLHAFYLDEKDSAIQLLETVIGSSRVDSELEFMAKLDLGDIYLLLDQPWESTLLYAQVEKSAKETALGYEAKLKNAKLSYYTGDFALAQAHLDILKLATSREIANDAMNLSLLIQNNTVFDTTQKAMREYAHIDLLLFQHKHEEALARLEAMLTQFPGHSLTDEIWWRKAHIFLSLGKFDQAITLLDKIVNQYPYDILSDDAAFLMATIYEDHLEQKEKAMELYQNFLVNYPGSLFSAEARKRFRNLRGDFSGPM